MGEAKRRALGAVPVTVEHRHMAARIDARIRQLDALGMQDELRAANVLEGSSTMLMRILNPWRYASNTFIARSLQRSPRCA